jgi:hypothetical protein
LSGAAGRSALKIKKSQEKSNKVKINQLNAILTDLPGIYGEGERGWQVTPADRPWLPAPHNVEGFNIKPRSPIISPWLAPKNRTAAICLFMFIYAKFMQTLRF